MKFNKLFTRNASLSVVLALLISFVIPTFGPWSTVPRANAASSVNFAGSYLNFDADTLVPLGGFDTVSPDVGDVYLYPSAGVIEGVSVDVTVEIISKSGTVSNWDWDPSDTTQFNGQNPNQAIKDTIVLWFNDGTVVFRFKFWETGSVTYASGISGVPGELRNLQVNTYDLDGGQSAAFSGFQSYEVNDTFPVFVEEIAGTNLVRFRGEHNLYNGAPSCCSNTSSFTLGRVRVTYDQATSVDIRIFAPSSAVYALQFGAGVAWASATSSPNAFNRAPQSTNTSKRVEAQVVSPLNIADFGNYSDPDSNPLTELRFESAPDIGSLKYFNGTSTTSLTVGSTVSADAVRAGRLSFESGTAPSVATVSFRVGDGLTFSAVAYSLSLTVVQSPQVITFPERIDPISPISGAAAAFSSSATSSAQLPVTLTSNTPSVCGIHANGTDIVPLLTTVRSVCTVTATQQGNGTFASAQPVTRNFYFSNNAITFPQPANQTFVSGFAVSSSAVASSSLPVTLVALTPSICTVSGLNILTVAAGNCSVRAESAAGTANGITYLAPFPVIRTFTISSGNTFAITYDANTGVGNAPANQSAVTTVTVGTGSLTKPGFDFAGWNANNTGSGTNYATGSSITLTANLTLYAKWVATVTFDSQGGSSVANQQYVFGQSGLTLPTSTKAGSTFAGWATTPTGAVVSGTYSSGSATLYAIWTSGSGGNAPYNGPEITSITPRIVTNLGGELVRVEGRRLGAGNHVTIGGIQVPISNASATGFSFVMPALSVRVWDMLYTYDGGARLTYIDAITVITFVAPPAVDSNSGSGVVQPTKSPVVPKPWVAIEVASKFAPGSPVINQAVRNEVNLMLRKHARFAKNIECTGFTMGPSVLRVDAKLSLDRATNVCRLIKQLRPKLNVISFQGKQELRLGGEIRRVEVRFTR